MPSPGASAGRKPAPPAVATARTSDLSAHGHGRTGPLAVLGISFAAGAVPFSGLAARALAGVDLRRRGTGTVSGTGLYEVAGLGPLVVAGGLDLAKGTVGPLLAGRDRPLLGALAAGAAVAGHNWSPLLGGAGGRGMATALGATAVLAPEGTVVLATGLAAGRLARQTGLGCLLAVACLFPVLVRRRGGPGLALATALAVPVVAKRLAGNQPAPRDRRAATVWSRLLFDRDPAAVAAP